MQKETQRLRIFLVEDHSDTRKWLTAYLADQGHDVQSTGTMTEALGHLATGVWDVLISDIGLSDGDGWELMARLGEKRPPSAVAMSGFGTHADRAKSETHGFAFHLLKPFLPEDLDEILSKCNRRDSFQKDDLP